MVPCFCISVFGLLSAGGWTLGGGGFGLYVPGSCLSAVLFWFHASAVLGDHLKKKKRKCRKSRRLGSAKTFQAKCECNLYGTIFGEGVFPRAAFHYHYRYLFRWLTLKCQSGSAALSLVSFMAVLKPVLNGGTLFPKPVVGFKVVVFFISKEQKKSCCAVCWENSTYCLEPKQSFSSI